MHFTSFENSKPNSQYNINDCYFFLFPIQSNIPQLNNAKKQLPNGPYSRALRQSTKMALAGHCSRQKASISFVPGSDWKEQSDGAVTRPK